jgi:hypothetical protein
MGTELSGGIENAGTRLAAAVWLALFLAASFHRVAPLFSADFDRAAAVA